MSRPLFLRWALVTALAVVALAIIRLLYHGHVHPAGTVAIVAVLAIFVAANCACGLLAWQADSGHRPTDSRLDDIAEAVEACPKVAMLGTVAGFLIALSGDAASIQQRMTGASTGLAATFVGIACMIVLGLQLRLLARHARP